MKKLPELWPVAAFLAVACVAAAGCTKPGGEPIGESTGVRAFTDKNGCQYLIVMGSHGSSDITPRMRPDGQQECGQ